MKKTSHLIFVILISSLLIKCSQETRSEFQDVHETFTLESFEERKILKGTRIDLGTLLAPIHIYFYDSLLFVATNGLDKNLSIYNSNADFSAVGSIVTNGMGPDDLLSVMRMDFDIDGTFWVHDAVTAKMKKFEIDFKGDSIYAVAQKDVSLKGPVTNAIFLIPDQIGATTQDINPLKRFYLYDIDGARKGEVSEYPNYNREIPATAKVEVFNGRISVHPKKDQFVLVYEYADLIEFYNSRFNLTKRIHGPHVFVPEFELKDRGNHPAMKLRYDKTRFAYQDVVSNSEEIFLLYANGRTVSKEDGDEAFHYDTIVVVDWEGNPLSLFSLDHTVISICVDWNKRVIYGLNRIESEVYAFSF